jgi:hypothetical protein
MLTQINACCGTEIHNLHRFLALPAHLRPGPKPVSLSVGVGGALMAHPFFLPNSRQQVT